MRFSNEVKIIKIHIIYALTMAIFAWPTTNPGAVLSAY